MKWKALGLLGTIGLTAEDLAAWKINQDEKKRQKMLFYFYLILYSLSCILLLKSIRNEGKANDPRKSINC